MGHRVRLVIPTDNEQEIAPIIGRVIGRWDGCTVTSGYGWWNSGGKTIRDKLSVLECSLGVWDQNAREWWHCLSDVVRVQQNQECVFLSVVTEHAELIYSSDKREPIGDQLSVTM